MRKRPIVVQGIYDTMIDTWFERDRAHVALHTKDGRTILEFWDDDVDQLVEDGFLNPRKWHTSMFEYAKHLGALDVARSPARLSGCGCAASRRF